MKSSGPKIIIKPRLARSSAAASTSKATSSSTRTSTPSRPSRRTTTTATPKSTRKSALKTPQDELESGEEELESEFTEPDEQNKQLEGLSDVVMEDGDGSGADLDEGEDRLEDEEDDQQEVDDDGDVSLAAPVIAATPTPRGKSRARGGRAAVAAARAGSVNGSVASGSGTGVGTPTRGRGRSKAVVKPRVRATKNAKATTGGGAALTIRLPGRAEEDAEKDASDGGKESSAVGGAVEEVVEEKEKEKEKEKEVPMGGGKPFRKIQGKVYVIENDEFVTDDDPKGDTKMDANGYLLGGRRFKASTFPLPNRHPHRQYMLAIDAARTSGFRDSLYYFRRNLLALKLNATQPEKDFLIEAGKLGSHLRTRSVTLITARSAYKLHGSKMIIDGKWVTDDYYEEKSLEEITARGLKAGDPVGELPDPQLYTSESALLAAALKAGGAGAGASGGAGAGGGGGSGGASTGMYRAGGPTTIFGGNGWGPYSDGPLNPVRKALFNREGMNEENWMLVAAQRVGEAGDEWARTRKEALRACGGILGQETGEDASGESGASFPMGVYEPHGGIVHYRMDTQPTRSRWEVCPDSNRRRVLGGTRTGNGAWALAWVETIMELPITEEQPSI